IPPRTSATALTGDVTVGRGKRQSGGVCDTVSADLPARGTLTPGKNEPRYPTLKGIMGAKKKEIRKYSAADLGLGPDDVGAAGARERVLTVGRPPARPRGRTIKDEGDGGKQIAEFLVGLKLV